MAYGETIDIESRLFRRLTADQRILAQAIRMRLDTRRGLYWDDPEYGLAVSDYVLDGMTPAQVALLEADVARELEKDERVAAVSVTASKTTTAGGRVSVRLELLVTPATGDSLPMTLDVSQASVDILTRGSP